MVEVKESIPLERLRKVKKGKEGRLALVSRDLENTRAKKRYLRNKLASQSIKVEQMQKRMEMAANDSIIMKIRNDRKKVAQQICILKFDESRLQSVLVHLNTNIENGVKKVDKGDYDISFSNFRDVVSSVAIVAALFLSAQVGFFVSSFLVSYSTALAVFGFAGAYWGTLVFCGFLEDVFNKKADSISVLKAKEIKAKELQMKQNELTEAYEKEKEILGLIAIKKEEMMVPSEEELDLATTEKRQMEAELNDIESQENALLEEKLRLAGGLETVEGLCEGVKPKEASQEKQKSFGPLVVRHPGNNI